VGDHSGWSDTRDFQCGENCLSPTAKANCTTTDPRYHPRNGSYNEGGVQCFCDSTRRENKAVGREKRGGYHRGSNAVVVPGPEGERRWWGVPPQCGFAFQPPCLRSTNYHGYDYCIERGGCLQGKPAATLHGWSAESTIAKACDACTADHNCSGWALTTPDNKTATLFHGPVTSARPPAPPPLPRMRTRSMLKRLAAAHKLESCISLSVDPRSRQWMNMGVSPSCCAPCSPVLLRCSDRSVANAKRRPSPSGWRGQLVRH